MVGWLVIVERVEGGVATLFGKAWVVIVTPGWEGGGCGGAERGSDDS